MILILLVTFFVHHCHGGGFGVSTESLIKLNISISEVKLGLGPTKTHTFVGVLYQRSATLNRNHGKLR